MFTYAATPVYHEGFEQGLPDWKCSVPLKLDNEQTLSGGHSLYIQGKSKLITSPLPVRSNTRYRLVFPVYAKAFASSRLHVEVYDRAKKRISIPIAHQTNEWLWTPGNKRKNRNFWLPMSIDFDTGKNAASVVVVFQTGIETAKIWIDNITLEALDTRPNPLIDPKPAHESRTTEDSLFLPGPDGRLYPSFTYAGLPHPWQLPEARFRVEDFGAVADDDNDDTDAIEQAIRAASENGNAGGVVLFGPGSYHVTRNLTIHGNRVVLSGVDRDRSRLVFGLPRNNIGIFAVGGDNRLAAKTVLKVYFPVKDAQKLTLLADGQKMEQFTSDNFILVKGTEFAMVSFQIAPHFEKLNTDVPVRITSEIIYGNDRQETSTIVCTVDPKHRPDRHGSSYITFAGRPNEYYEEIPLASDLKRGERLLTIDVGASDNRNFALGIGDYVELGFTLSKRWSSANNSVPWWKKMQFYAKIASVDGARGERITLTQPVRLDFTRAEKAYVRKVDLIRGSGIENLTLEQAGNIQAEMQLRTISFYDAAECRASGLIINRPGTGGLYGVRVKNCEFVDCRIVRPWSTRGLAYAGWDYAWDCLMDRFETDSMRHAPLFNWCASGNVVTGGVFRESDAQWHTGWCHDNLLENSRISTTTKQFGSYGWAFYAVPYDDGEHGAIGPRNVIYNCESKSFNGGLFMGGMTRDWIVVYNKFVTSSGPGILEKIGSGGNVFADNVFVLGDTTMPMLYIESLDSHATVDGNRLYGSNGQFVSGPGHPAVFRNNRLFPLPAHEGNVERPQVPVPSLYRWQLNKFRPQSSEKAL